MSEPFWKREIPPTMTPRQVKARLEALKTYLEYRRCDYKMGRLETYCYVLEQGIRSLERDLRDTKEAKKLK